MARPTIAPVVPYTQLPTYDSLVDMLKVYLNRRDQDTLEAMPFFVNAAEKTILRELRMPALERIVQFEMPEEGWIFLPMDYLEMKHVWLEDGNPGTLQRITFDEFLRDPSNESNSTFWGGKASCGNGSGSFNDGNTQFNSGVWAITGDRLYIKGPTIGQMVYMNYYQDVPEVSADTQSNQLLELVPDVFLYFAVAEGFRFLMEPEKADYWQTSGYSRLKQVQQQVYNEEFSGSPLTVSHH